MSRDQGVLSTRAVGSLLFTAVRQWQRFRGYNTIPTPTQSAPAGRPALSVSAHHVVVVWVLGWHEAAGKALPTRRSVSRPCRFCLVLLLRNSQCVCVHAAWNIPTVEIIFLSEFCGIVFVFVFVIPQIQKNK